MRLIHTADWHLGRIFHGVHLTEDQAHVLDQLVCLVKDIKPDALLLSGDVYDRAVPPPEAVALLDDVLSRIVLGLRVPVLIIAGNHDSPDRLGFASRLLSEQDLHVVGPISSDVASVTLRDKHGPVNVYALPYAEPAVVRERIGSEEVRDHDSAFRALVDRALQLHPDGARSILMAHAFVLKGKESESERPLSVGGAGFVSASCFAGFNYVALGHLHRPQSIGGNHINYSGSLLKYSFSESSHTKSVNMVEINDRGKCKVERILLTPRYDVRCIKGTLEKLLKGSGKNKNREDYLMVTLLDSEPILDAMGKLRSVYPNVLYIERPSLMVDGQIQGSAGDHRRLSDTELFAAFFSQVTGEQISKVQAKTYAAIVDELHQRDREATL